MEIRLSGVEKRLIWEMLAEDSFLTFGWIGDNHKKRVKAIRGNLLRKPGTQGDKTDDLYMSSVYYVCGLWK